MRSFSDWRLELGPQPTILDRHFDGVFLSCRGRMIGEILIISDEGLELRRHLHTP